MTLRFQVDKRGTVHNNIVDLEQPKLNGAGIIASSHSEPWAQTICEALNYCLTAGNPTSIPTPKQEADLDT